MHTYMLAEHKGFTVVEVLSPTVIPDLSYILFVLCGCGETQGGGGEEQLLWIWRQDQLFSGV